MLVRLSGYHYSLLARKHQFPHFVHVFVYNTTEMFVCLFVFVFLFFGFLCVCPAPFCLPVCFVSPKAYQNEAFCVAEADKAMG
jgi:hypothetical protein